MIRCWTIYGLRLNSEPRNTKLLFNYIIHGEKCTFYYRFPKQKLLEAEGEMDQDETSHFHVSVNILTRDFGLAII